MVSECIEGYALLLENILRLPSEVALPKAVSEIPLNLKEKWQWHFFESVSNSTNLNGTLRTDAFLDKFEELWNQTQLERLTPKVAADDTFIYSIWQDEKYTQMEYAKKRREEEEVRHRHVGGTWNVTFDIYIYIYICLHKIVNLVTCLKFSAD